MPVFSIYDLQKKREGIVFRESLDLSEELRIRSKDILSVSQILVEGRVRYEANFYFLDYQLTYEITLLSSRSMEPVLRKEVAHVHEVFVATDGVIREKEMVDEDLVLVIEGEEIVLEESVADNILLNIPLRILTPEEEAGAALPSGSDWTVMTEEEFQQANLEQKKANNPFSSLQGLFDDER